MTISKRRWVGIALIGSAFITGLVLVCLLYRGRVLESHSYSTGNSSFSFTVTMLSVRLPAWIHFSLLGLGGIGLVLLLIPTRQIDA